MTTCRFEKIVVIGCGKLAATALKYIASLRDKYGFSLLFIEHELQEMSVIAKVCEEEKVPYLQQPDKALLTAYLDQIEEKTLIVSAGNYYLFRKSLLCKEHITVINFHNALLPKYPGRNAPSWAIYYGEKESGPTWHLVTEAVDAGEILWQKAHPITEDTKAYELTGHIMRLAQEGIEAFLEPFLAGEVPTLKQTFDPNRKMFYSCEIPADGCVSVKDDPAHLYRTLRAMDYGKFGPLPPLALRLEDGRCVEVVRYRRKKKDGTQAELSAPGNLILAYDEETILTIKYKEKEEQ
jgi:methionyl-tRNA formyltransferase